MKKIPLHASEEVLIKAVEEWVDLLVAKKFQEALDFIYPIPYPEWNAGYLERWIGNYGFDQPLKDGSKVEITSRVDAKGNQYSREYEPCDPHIDEATGLEVVGMVFYDVPLDGEWSDLTAQFQVCELKGELVLDMHGLHVM